MSGAWDLTDDQVRRIWRWVQETPPLTWKDRVAYRLTWRPRWAVRLWRKVRP